MASENDRKYPPREKSRQLGRKRAGTEPVYRSEADSTCREVEKDACGSASGERAMYDEDRVSEAA